MARITSSRAAISSSASLFSECCRQKPITLHSFPTSSTPVTVRQQICLSSVVLKIGGSSNIDVGRNVHTQTHVLEHIRKRSAARTATVRTSTENITVTGMTLPSGYVPFEKELVTPTTRTFSVCTATLLPMADILNLPRTVMGAPGGASARSASCFGVAKAKSEDPGTHNVLRRQSGNPCVVYPAN